MGATSSKDALSSSSEYLISQQIDFGDGVLDRPTSLITHRDPIFLADVPKVPEDSVGVTRTVSMTDQDGVTAVRYRKDTAVEPAHYLDIRRNLHGAVITHSHGANVCSHVQRGNA